MISRTASRIALTLTLATLCASCGDELPIGSSDNGSNSPKENLFVTGRITPRDGHSLPDPASMGVFIAWPCDDVVDYVVVSEGVEFYLSGNQYSLTLASAPSPQALTRGTVGVGFLFIAPIDSVHAGVYVDPDSLAMLERNTIAISEEYGILYLPSAPSEIAASANRPWITAFNKGYNVGKGVRKESVHDEFEPAAADDIEIVVDDPKSLRWVNWM